MTGGRRDGVLVMAHGTPATPDDLESFYTSIRRGRPPTPELLADLESRYRAIGGVSPLSGITRAQVAALAAELERRAPSAYLVGYGAKHVEPSIERGLSELVERGATRVVGLVLTPHESGLGSGSYLERAAAAASSLGVELVPVRSWHRAHGFPELLAERTERALAGLDAGAAERVSVFFTAHSLPVTDGDDPYPGQVAETADDVAGLLGFATQAGLDWGVAWQSAGKAPGAWLSPDLLGEIERVAGGGASAVVVCPVGFVADHLEVLYDLDVEAAGRATELGLAFRRTASLNDDPRFAAVLAGAVSSATVEGPAGEGRVHAGRVRESPGGG